MQLEFGEGIRSLGLGSLTTSKATAPLGSKRPGQGLPQVLHNRGRRQQKLAVVLPKQLQKEILSLRFRRLDRRKRLPALVAWRLRVPTKESKKTKILVQLQKAWSSAVHRRLLGNDKGPSIVRLSDLHGSYDVITPL